MPLKRVQVDERLALRLGARTVDRVAVGERTMVGVVDRGDELALAAVEFLPVLAVVTRYDVAERAPQQVEPVGYLGDSRRVLAEVYEGLLQH